jgi:predicted CoA-binding protein|tara:strand:- start:180 stop:584 length:405 start_codon:yes stop_codon:yes gene_type:complete
MKQTKKQLKNILGNVNTIAIVGASSNTNRDSFKVMKYLINEGYDVIPVNPNETNNKILGKKCFQNLKSIKRKLDMVDIFRAKKYVNSITQDAIEIEVKVIWTQEGITDEESSILAKKAGIIFVMDECPKKILEN